MHIEQQSKQTNLESDTSHLSSMTNFILLINLTILCSLFLVSADDFPVEKKVHLRFFFHDIVNGSDPTAVIVAQASKTEASPWVFGRVVVADNLLTRGPELNSKLIGKAQGLYAFSSKEEFSLTMLFNLVFLDGKYNGSTLTVIGRNAFLMKERELPVVGGTGRFRMARGYALAKTSSLNFTSNDATVEWNVYVWHY